MGFRHQTREITLQGWVLATDWDEKDNPTAFVFQSYHDQGYIIEEGDDYNDLINIPGAEVLLTGILHDSGPRIPVIEVVSFEVLDLQADDDDDNNGELESEADGNFEDYFEDDFDEGGEDMYQPHRKAG